MQRLNMLLGAIAALVLLAHSAFGQNSSTSIDPNSVDIITRSQWCNSHKDICKKLCNGCVNEDSCFAETLVWNLTCCDTSITPDVAAYKNTVPYWVCETSWEICNKNSENNAQGQAACKNNILSKCGSKDISDYVAPSSTASSSASASATTTSASATAASASPTKSSAANALSFLGEYGTGVWAAGLMIAFGFLD